ncbi:phosphoglucosamine mutase [Candidatus Poribacteria bacterium]|nr:phosphoglucosamine mutase [Candidatus Poribacteria bacterium]MYB64825.1 phosphoglucosamine mutase [Candidatus Poribacteria bacterium]
MKKLKDPIVSVSGVRGEVGVSLDMQTITRFALAFGTLVGGGTVVLGIDSRTSSPMVRHAVLAGLIATGCQVMDVGLCPTPTVLLTAKVLNAQGSITITASHNPVAWNGIEFASEAGQLLTQTERDELLHIYDTENFELMPWDKLGAHQVYTESTSLHLERILNSSWLDIDSIRNAKLKVALDCGNGAGCVISPTLLKELGCEVIEVNCIPDGNFNRPAEPNPDAITELVETVVNTGADIGFAHDGDADRVVIVTDSGIALNGEWTFAFVTDFIISKTKGDIVATVSTSRMIDDIAIKHNVKLHRTKVGVGYVVEKMHEVNAVIGGEGTGGVIYPDINHTTDGITSIAAILQHLVESEIIVSALVDAMPQYEMCRKKMEIPSQAVASQLLAQYKDEITSTHSDTSSLELTDGIKRVWDDRWVNIRKSGTEPVIRIFSEAPTASEAELLCNQTVERLELLMKQIKR